MHHRGWYRTDPGHKLTSRTRPPPPRKAAGPLHIHQSVVPNRSRLRGLGGALAQDGDLVVGDLKEAAGHVVPQLLPAAGDAQVALAQQRHQRRVVAQVLYEIRAPGGSTANLNAGPPQSDPQYGVVGYTHAGGIDQPLRVIRQHHPAGLTTLVPHANYRGVYRAGTRRDGTLHVCEGTGGCVNVLWPAPIRGAYHQGDATGGDWVGSLIPGMQDASGLLYKRNRYYNPQTGQFTQPDPIGIAGGLNTYGFAEGDPVSFDDPYELKVVYLNRAAERLWGDLRRLVTTQMNSRDPEVRAAAFNLNLTANAIDRSENSMKLHVGRQGGLRGAQVRGRFAGAMTYMPWKGFLNDDART
jgi:uncharacterized protein RhaS with RHS repeats